MYFDIVHFFQYECEESIIILLWYLLVFVYAILPLVLILNASLYEFWSTVIFLDRFVYQNLRTIKLIKLFQKLLVLASTFCNLILTGVI